MIEPFSSPVSNGTQTFKTGCQLYELQKFCMFNWVRYRKIWLKETAIHVINEKKLLMALPSTFDQIML